jgi:hypothetical protein
LKFLDNNAAQGFLKTNSKSDDILRESSNNSQTSFIKQKFHLPNENGVILSALRLIAHQCAKESWTIAIIESAGIWPSWQDLNLYRMMRLAHHVDRNWQAGEGHLFELGDEDDLISFSYVFAMFRWDFRIVTSNNALNFFSSHDDFCICHADSAEEIFWTTLKKILVPF